jgi:hypothetical protein
LELPDTVDFESFAWMNLIGVDRWVDFTPTFGSLTVVGATNYTGRLRIVGRKCEFQLSFSAATSIASTAGTTYLNLPVKPAKGFAGFGAMTNGTTNIAVGLCDIDITNSRCYLPAQAASGDTFKVFSSYEI